MPNQLTLASPGVQQITHDPTVTINGDPMATIGDNPYGTMSDEIIFGGVNLMLGWIDDLTGLNFLGLATSLEGLLTGNDHLATRWFSWMTPDTTGLGTGTHIFNPVMGSGSAFHSSLIPPLDASKITTGTLATSVVQPVIDAVANGFGGELGYDLGQLATFLGSLVLGGDGGINWGALYNGLTGSTDGDFPALVHLLTFGLFGSLPPSRISHVPIGAIGDNGPNMLDNGGFDGQISLDEQFGWIWNGDIGHTNTGCANATADGNLHTQYSDPVFIDVNQPLSVGVWTRYDAVTATASSNGIQFQIEAYSGTEEAPVFVSNTMIDKIVSPSGSSSGAPGDNNFLMLSGTYTVPAGVTHIRMVLVVTAAVSAGDVYFDDAWVQLTRILPAPLVETTGLLQDTWNAIANALSGSTHVTDNSLDPANNAMVQFFETLLGLTHEVQSLKSTAIATTNSGAVVNFDFSEYDDGPLPSEFTTVYYDFGASPTSTMGITNGTAGFIEGNNLDRSAIVTYNGPPTDTDFQVVRGAMASPPQAHASNSFGIPRIWAIARVDNPANPLNFVFARGWDTGAFSYRAEIGCWVNGIETIWATNIPLTWSLDMFLVAGVGSNPRTYQLFSGNKLVKELDEPGTASHLGVGYRQWGSAAEIKQGTVFTGLRNPGRIAGCSAYDNQLPTVLGSYARMYRTSTTGVAVANGINPLPTNFFSVVAECTNDIVADEVAGTFTMSEKGNYRVDFLSETTALAWPDRIRFYAIKNGTTLIQMGSEFLRGVNALGGVIIPGSVGGSATIPLDAGDVIKIAVSASSAVNSVLTGTSTGMNTYFTVALANKSLA